METEPTSILAEQEKVIFDAVAEIDSWLAQENTKPSLRPFKAAILFVEHFVLEVSGGDKENFAEQAWFAVVFHHVRDWYDQNYGAQMHEQSDGFSRAVVGVRGIPVKFKVPLTRSVVEVEGVTAWLCFPNAIEDGEDPTHWLVDAPPIANLLRKDRDKLERECRRTAVALRNVRLNTQGLTGSSEVIDGLVSGILPELEAAAGHIVTNKPEAFGLAAWCLQMALERTLNSLALQKHGNYKKTHDLFSLFDLVAVTLAPMNRDLMKGFLRQGEVMDARYGQGKGVEREQIFKSYLAAIEFVANATSKFDRTLSVSGGRLLLKMPPWLALPGKDATE